MEMTLDKFRLNTWVRPEPFVHYLMERIYPPCAKKNPQSWFWKEPGHLHCLIHLSLFGHMSHQKYRYLMEAYHRCDLEGTLAAQSAIAAQLQKFLVNKEVSLPRYLIVALILCGVEHAGPADSGPVTNRGTLVNTIIGELDVGRKQRPEFKEGLIKSARRDVQIELNRVQESKRVYLSQAPELSKSSPEASFLFPSTFAKADGMARDVLAKAPSQDLQSEPPLHEIWQRILVGPHPLSILEVSWILVHFRLRLVHARQCIPAAR